MKKLSQGQVVYTAMCYEHGGMIDDGTVLLKSSGLKALLRNGRPTCNGWRVWAATIPR